MQRILPTRKFAIFAGEGELDGGGGRKIWNSTGPYELERRFARFAKPKAEKQYK